MTDKKGQMGIGGLSNTAITLMITGIVLMFAVIIVTQLGDSDFITAGSDAEGAYNDTLDSVTEFSGWLPTIAILAVAGLIIYIVVRSFPRVQ